MDLLREADWEYYENVGFGDIVLDVSSVEEWIVAWEGFNGHRLILASSISNLVSIFWELRCINPSAINTNVVVDLER